MQVRRADEAVERARVVADLVAAGRERTLPEAAVDPEHAQEWVDAIRADRDR